MAAFFICQLSALAQACAALDRAESLAATITREGETIATPGGLRAHPCLKDEVANRALVVRCLQRLGLLEEPVKGMGRPSRPTTWTPDDD